MKSFGFLFVLLFQSVVAFAANRTVILRGNNNGRLTPAMVSAANTTYQIESPFTLGGSVVTLHRNSKIIIGHGRLSNGTLNLMDDSSIKGNSEQHQNLYLVVRGSGVSIESLSVRNVKGVVLRSFSDCDDLHVSNCHFTSISDNCIKLVADHIKGTITGVRIANSNFSFKRMGIELQNHAGKVFRFDGVNISGCKFDGLTTNQLGYAVSLSGYGRNVTVSNNQFRSCNIGVELVGFSYVQILQNTFANIYKGSIVASNSRHMNNLIIKGNNINCPNAKLQLQNCSASHVTGNICNIKYLELIKCDGITVTGNTLTSNGAYSIMLDMSSGNQVYDNTIQQNGRNWAVIRCYGGLARNNVVEGNRIRKNGSGGVLFDQKNGANGNRMQH